MGTYGNILASFLAISIIANPLPLMADADGDTEEPETVATGAGTEAADGPATEPQEDPIGAGPIPEADFGTATDVLPGSEPPVAENGDATAVADTDDDTVREDTGTGPVTEPDDLPDIVINEVQIAGAAAVDEFVELRNTDTEAASLSGLRLCRRTSGSSVSQMKSFSKGDVVPGGGYFLFAHTDGVFADISDASTKSSPLATDNAIALVSGNSCDGPDTVILDSVAWGDGNPFDGTTPRTGNPAPGESLTRDADAGDWHVSTEPTPTNSHDETVGTEEDGPGEDPGTDPAIPVPGTVILNEIFPNPVDEAGEWVELFNLSDEAVPLAGWMLHDLAKEHPFPEDSAIEGNGFLVIHRIDSGLALNNGSETVTLVMSDGTVSDSFGYATTEEGFSWARNIDGDFKLTDLATPGETNRFPFIAEPVVAPLPPDGGLRINEVYPDPETKGETDEWIELANTSDMDISLAGFILRDASKSGKYVFGDAVAIGAGAFLVLPRSETKISLNNSRETLRFLWSDDETVIASLSYDRTVEGASYGHFKDGRYRFSGKVTPGKANRFGKEPKIEGYDIPKKGYRDIPAAFSAKGNEDDMRYVWDFGDGHKSYKQETTHRYGKTDTYHGSLTVRGDIEEVVKTFTIKIEKYPKYDLRITALLPNPDGRDTGFEWIRVWNREEKEVDLTGWIIATGTTEDRLVNHAILTENLRIGGGDSLTLTRADSRFSLPNESAVIELRRPDGDTVQTVEYSLGKSAPDDAVYADTGNGWVWIVPSTGNVAIGTAETEMLSFPAGRSENPDYGRISFGEFLVLGTPYRIDLPEFAPRVLGLSDARLMDDGSGTSRIGNLFRTLNRIVVSLLAE